MKAPISHEITERISYVIVHCLRPFCRLLIHGNLRRKLRRHVRNPNWNEICAFEIRKVHRSQFKPWQFLGKPMSRTEPRTVHASLNRHNSKLPKKSSHMKRQNKYPYRNCICCFGSGWVHGRLFAAVNLILAMAMCCQEGGTPFIIWMLSSKERAMRPNDFQAVARTD